MDREKVKELLINIRSEIGLFEVDWKVVDDSFEELYEILGIFQEEKENMEAQRWE